MNRNQKLIGLISLWVILVILNGCNEVVDKSIRLNGSEEFVPPRTYKANKIKNDIIIDGIDSEAEWDQAEWSEDFLDISYWDSLTPTHQTRIKMLWSDEYLYVFAHMSDPHVWATLQERDAVVYYDDDIEVFIDPDGDGHNYTEIEVNAYNTVWDLFLTHPYRNSRSNNVLWNWDIRELKTAVSIQGSLNDSSDQDTGWTCEMAIPLNILHEFANNNKAASGAIWRINFSRVDWQMEIVNGTYAKQKDENGKNLPENNWVWSPTGQINMHMPERWGYLLFLEGKPELNEKPNHRNQILKANLFEAYLDIWKMYKEEKQLPANFPFTQFRYQMPCDVRVEYHTLKDRFMIRGESCENGEIWQIDEAGRLSLQSVISE